jgi:hypothetical protein
MKGESKGGAESIGQKAEGARIRKLEAGSWKLEAGSWKLEAGSWKLEAGSWEPEFGSREAEARSWQLRRRDRDCVTIPLHGSRNVLPSHTVSSGDSIRKLPVDIM